MIEKYTGTASIELSQISVDPFDSNRLSEEFSLDNFRNYYDVSAEINFVQENFANLEPSQRNLSVELYLRNQILRFIEEFAFGLERQQIGYFLGNDGKLYAPGVQKPSEESYKKASEVAKSYGFTREQAELEGFLSIQEALSQDSETVIYFSPPSFGREGFGDYSFVFIFRKNGSIVDVDIIRLEGEDERLSRVTKGFIEVITRAQQFGVELGEISERINLQRAEDFLRTPIVVKKNSEVLLKNLSFYGGAEYKNIEERLMSDSFFNDFFEGYIKAVQEGDENKALLYLKALYVRASEIREVLETKGEEVIFYNPYNPDNSELKQQILFYYVSQQVNLPLGSCPVVVGNNVRIFQNLLELNGGRIDYGLANLVTSGEGEMKCVKCPECGHIVDAKVKNGKIICPECGASKELS